MGSLKLDLKDRKILAELDWNARISNSELAKKIGLSKKNVEYRIKKLEQNNFIHGYYPLIDFGRLGFYSRRVELILQNADARVKKRIEEYIIKDKDIGWAIWFGGGRCDLGYDVWSNSLGKFKAVFNRFNTLFGRYIKQRRFSTASGFEQYPYRFILGKNSNESILIGESKEIVKLDELDKKILRVLCLNARQSASEMARKIKSNYKTVIYRMNELQRKGVYLGARVQIDESLFGYNYYKLLLYFNYYDDKIYNTIKSYFKNMIECVYVVDHIDSDLDVEIMLKSDGDLFDLVDKLNEVFPNLIKEYEYWKFLRTIKVVYMPNLE